MVRSFHRTAGVVALCAGAAAAAQPITAYWLHPVSGLWHQAANWSTAPTYPNNPGSALSYEAVIDAVGGPYTVELAPIVGIDRLTMNSTDATLRLTGILSLGEDSVIHAGTFHLDSGMLAGAGGLTSHGTVRWTAGGVESGGALRIAQGGSLLIEGTGIKSLTHRELINDGQAQWTQGQWWLTGAQITNNGQFTVDTSLGALSAYAINAVDSAFTNTGQFTKLGAGEAQFFQTTSSAARFNNHGVVDVTQGSLALLAGGYHTGAFNIGEGALLRLSGNHTLSADASLVGAGSLSVVGGSFDHAGSTNIGGSATFSGGVSTFYGGPVTIGGAATFPGGVTSLHGPASFGSLLINGGAVAFHGPEIHLTSGATLASGSLGGAADQIIGSSFQWSGGTLADSGVTRVESGAVMTVNGNTSKFLERHLVNDGEIVMSRGRIRVDGGELINNGVLRFDGQSLAEFLSIASATPGEPSDLINYGTIISKRGSVDIATANFFNHGVLDLTNIGTIVQTTEIYSNLIHTGEILNQTGLELHGSSVFAPGAKITGTGGFYIMDGVHDFTPGVYAGTGTLRIEGGNVTLHEQPTGFLQAYGGTVNFEYIPSLGTTFNRPAQLNFNAGYNAPAGAALVITSEAGAGGVDFGSSDMAFSTGSIFGGLGGSGQITFSGPVEWRGGTMDGAGSTILGAAAPLTLSQSTKTLGRTLVANADVQWTGGDLVLDGGVFHNLAGLTSTGQVDMRSAGAGGLFINDGSIDVESGALGLRATTQNNGAIQIASDATLRIGGQFTQGDGGSISGSGAVEFVDGEHLLEKGFLSTSGPVRVAGGEVTIATPVNTASWSFLGGTANFTLDTAFPALTLEGGAIGGAGQLHIDNLHWIRGELLEGGEAEIAAGGALTFGAEAADTRSLSRTLTNNGSAALNAGALSIDGGHLINEGQFVLSAGAAIRAVGAGGAFENSGTLDIAGAGVAAIEGLGLHFLNTGAVLIASGSTLRLNAEITSGDLGSISGPGTLQFNGGYAVVQQGDLDVGAIRIAGGNVIFDVTPQAAFSFTGGAATFREAFTSATSVTISGTAARFEGGLALPSATLTVTNSASLELVGDDGAASVFRLQNGSLRGDGDMIVENQFQWNGGAMTGTGRTIVGGSATGIVSSFSPITLSRELINHGSLTYSTQFLRLNGGIIRNEGMITVLAGSGIQGLGAGGQVLNNGVIRVINGGPFNIQNLGGMVDFENYGLFEIGEGGAILLAGGSTTTNHGTYMLDRSSMIEVEGDFTNSSTAELTFTVGGAKDRGLFGLMTITGDAALAGALTVTTPESFVGAWGDRWTVLTFASLTSDFDAFDLPETTDGMLRWYAQTDGATYDVGVSHIADIDHDGLIGFADLNVIASNFNAFGAWSEGDVDGDGFVGFADLNTVLSLFNTSAPRNVPGPGAGVALALLSAAPGRRRSIPSHR